MKNQKTWNKTYHLVLFDETGRRALTLHGIKSSAAALSEAEHRSKKQKWPEFYIISDQMVKEKHIDILRWNQSYFDKSVLSIF